MVPIFIFISGYKFAINDINITLKEIQVVDLIVENNTVKGVVIAGKKVFADSVIVATGGYSYPSTGSTGA